MKRDILSAAAVAAAAFLLIGAEREGRSGGSSRGGRTYSAPAASPFTIYRRERVVVPRASMPAPENTLREPSRPVTPQRAGALPAKPAAVAAPTGIVVSPVRGPAPSAHHPVFPQRNESGARITQPAAVAPPSQHAAVVGNADIVRAIRRQQRVEVVPHRFFWHDVDGVRFCHFFDGRFHWWGFYNGPTFYWTFFWGDRWWWFDEFRGRWVFWSDGFWWWPGPGGAPYVYVGNNYYPYEDMGVTVERAYVQAPPSAIPASGEGSTINSPDGSRMVQIFGSEGQAFLFDKTKSPPTFMTYLGQGVSQVRFSTGTAGARQILAEYKDNTFALFDQDGNSQSSSVKTEEPAVPTPPEAPELMPPPPLSVPGR